MREKILNFISKYYLILLLIIFFIFFSVASDTFFNLRNIVNILLQNSYLVIATIGISMIMISGGADLSVSYQMGLISCVCGIMLVNLGLPTVVGVIVALLVGLLLGFTNGFFSVLLKVHPMVITLATMTIYQGLAYIISGSQTYIGFPNQFKALGQKLLFHGTTPLIVLIAAGFVILAYVLLNHTYLGRYIYAIGGNEEAARLTGINVNIVKLLAFTIAGLFVAVAAILLTARAGSGSAGICTDAVFTCFTACVLGGISFRGGSGRVIQTVIATIFLGMLANGMQMIGLSMYFQYVAKGVILILAIAFDNYQKKMLLVAAANQTKK